MTRYLLTIEYMGTGLAGWQRQEKAISVQQIIEDAFFQLYKTPIILFAAGRTDAGVHALAQHAHFDTDVVFEPYKFIKSMNFFMRPHAVAIYNIETVNADFHARFSARSRKYVYRILNRKWPSAVYKNKVWHVSETLDIEKMREGGTALVGRHDFTSLRSSRCQSKNPVKNITSIHIEYNRDLLEIEIEAPSFLHNQVRIIASVLAECGAGRLNAAGIEHILQARDRTKAPKTAPSSGLYFLGASY